MDIERILLECRYLISLNKNYSELAKIFHVDEWVIVNDLNNVLPNFDSILYKRVKKILNKNNTNNL